MAQRRMFSKKITETDLFLDMPMSSQCLYFHLNMSADDDGFISNAKTIRRMVGASEDDLKLLLAKEFVLPFESGVVVIKDWKIHNYIRRDRYNETVYRDEKRQLKENENGQYELGMTVGLPNDDQRLPQDRLGKDRLGKDSLGKGSSSNGVVSDNCDIVTNKSQVGHTEKEIELKKELNIEQQRQEEISVAPAADPISKMNAHEFYQNNFQVVESPFIAQSIVYWIEDLSVELVIEAMKRALLSEKGYKYAEGILKNWDKKNIKSMDEVKAEDVSFENSKNKGVANNGNSKPTSSEYDGFF